MESRVVEYHQLVGIGELRGGDGAFRDGDARQGAGPEHQVAFGAGGKRFGGRGEEDAVAGEENGVFAARHQVSGPVAMQGDVASGTFGECLHVARGGERNGGAVA